MSRHPDVLQIVTMGNTPLERFVKTEDAVELSKIGNEELAELVVKRPDLFYSAAGMVPIDDIDASIEIIDHCINDLNLLGIQLFTSLERNSLAEPKYRPIFARIAEHDKTIWIHPSGTDKDRGMFSWPYESSRFMLDIVNAGIFNDYPELRIIIHHAGAMVPFFLERVRTIMPQHTEKYFKNFYVDTALYGNTPGLMCALDFYGVEHMLFGTDAPMGAPHGANGNTSRTIMAIEQMSISDKDKEKIFQENAVDIFGRLL
jgi:predicted TIM-barrel fold metal-dependent hydrolase